MTTAATVPIFSPDGTLGDIPADQLTMAAKAGAKPGVHIIAPDGSPGVVPADRMRDAVQAGAKIVPIQDQPIQHPGFWVTLGSDLGGMAKGAWHAAVDPLTDTHEDLVRKLHEEQASDQAAQNSPERQAHGALYRNVTVPAAEAIGVNVPGMEKSAAEGDVSGVMGHAAAPVAAAAITHGVVKGAGALGEAIESPAGQATGAAVKAAAKKLPFAAVRRIPYVGNVAADVYEAGAEAAAKARGTAAGPELDATGENKPFAGEPPPKPQPVLDATGENKSFAGGMDEYVPPKAKAPRTIVTDPATGRPEFSDVVAAKQQAAATVQPTAVQQPPAAAQAAPVETKPAPTETPAAQAAPKAAPTETAPGPAADNLLNRLKTNAAQIAKEEKSAPGSADEDLTQQLQDSLAIVRARKAAAAAGKTPGGASSAGGDLNGIFQRLVKGEAGQAGLPGSVTNADEGIADIQNRPVLSQKSGQVPAHGFLNKVGATWQSVLKTPRDLDSVSYHQQQIAQNGPPNVELHVDEGGNVIGAQGRHRALAAMQLGGPNAPVNVTIFKHPYENPE